MFSIDAFHQEYETRTTEAIVNRKKFRILLPRDLDCFVNPVEMLNDFPLWAKIWQASWVLCGYLADMKPDPGKQLLEIGAGVGLNSIVAATFGHRITMTEYNSDALNFARANAHLNHCPGLPILKLDWHRPTIKAKCDTIVASEVTYKPEDYTALIQLFKSYLQPGGEIILTSEMRKSSRDFYDFFKTDFDIIVEKKHLRSDAGAFPVVLFKMQFHY